MYAIALRKIHADFPQLCQDGFVFDELGDDLDSHDVTYAVDGFDHGKIHRILRHVLDEGTIYFQIVHIQILQIGIGRHAAAEIIKREAAAAFLEFGNKVVGTADVCDGRGLGNLEANPLGRNTGTDEFIHNVLQEILVAQ